MEKEKLITLERAQKTLKSFWDEQTPKNAQSDVEKAITELVEHDRIQYFNDPEPLFFAAAE